MAQCPYCNSNKHQKRGFGYNLHGKYQRYQCIKCYRWFSFPPRYEVPEQKEPLYGTESIILRR